MFYNFYLLFSKDFIHIAHNFCFLVYVCAVYTICFQFKFLCEAGRLLIIEKITGPSAEELWKIREAIASASSLEEVERLNRLLQSGQIPGKGMFTHTKVCTVSI